MKTRRQLQVILMVSVVALGLGIITPAGSNYVKQIGDHIYGTVLETPHPYPGSESGKAELVWSDYFEYPEAAYIVFEFKQFDLAPGDWVEVRDPQGKQVHVYRGKGFKGKGGDFITKMITGPEAMIYLYSENPKPNRYGYRIERISRGYSDQELAYLNGGGKDPESICGTDDKENAKCFETSHPEVYDKARAVARIVMDGNELCTSWLVSCENHVMTNNHCTWDDNDFDTQGELDRMEFQFMYEDDSCAGGGTHIEYSFMSGTWLEHDRNLDYTLVQAPAGENPAATYGWLTLDLELPTIGEYMYIVGHPSGRPKEISLYSTHPSDPTGECQVQSITGPACIDGDIGEVSYYCDTEGGNSGSPVLSRENHKVIGLHHCGTCLNRGLRIPNIWNMNQAGSHPLPPCSSNNFIGSVALDKGTYGCADTVSIEVVDGSLVGTGSTTVQIWSDSEPNPGETVVLNETPADSGIFVSE